MMLRIFFSLIFVLSPCFGTWSPPVSLNFPQTVNGNLLTGDIDFSGDTVIVWQDPATGHQFSSIYKANSSSWGPVLTVTTDSVVNIATSINGVGEAVVAWVDAATGNLYASLNSGGGWSSKKLVYEPPVGVNLFNPEMSIDDAGNVLLVFSDIDGATTTVYWTYYTLGVWTPAEPLNSATGIAFAPTSVVEVDPAGDGIITWSYFNGSTASTYGASFNRTTEQVTVAPALGLNQPADPSYVGSNLNYVTAAISQNGKGIVSWTLGSGGIWSSLFLNGTWLPAVEIVVNSTTTNPAQVAINHQGLGLIVYTAQGGTTSIIASTFDGTSVNSAVVVDLDTSTSIINLTGSIDQFNNKAVAWADFDFAVGTLFPSLYVSTQPVGATSWFATLLYSGLIRDAIVTFSLVITPDEKAYLGWADGPFPTPNINVTAVNISVGTALFPPQPASNLSVRLVKNQFLFQQDLVHVLTWNLSPDDSTSSYLVYRNGVLVAQVTSNTFEDHNRLRGEKDVYTVIASNSAGVSLPITVSFP